MKIFGVECDGLMIARAHGRYLRLTGIVHHELRCRVDDTRISSQAISDLRDIAALMKLFYT